MQSHGIYCLFIRKFQHNMNIPLLASELLYATKTCVEQSVDMGSDKRKGIGSTSSGGGVSGGGGATKKAGPVCLD
jgi:uncharacterized membrane protein YgcG